MFLKNYYNAKRKDKVLIVISDGATCGSWKDLQITAENIEARGVTMLGIGIFDDNVRRIYKNHVILREQRFGNAWCIF